MLRLPSQQALWAVYKPLRNPLTKTLRNPLVNPLCHPQTRHVHIDQAPFSGPPSYATITRRFSSKPDPLVFVTKKRANEAKERGEFVDVHDVRGIMPKDYDVLITDVTARILRDEVAEIAGVPYLKKATKDENKKIDIGTGFAYGLNSRIMFPCVVGLEGRDRAYWTFFVVDSGSPHTYISGDVAEALGIVRGSMSVTIAGREQHVLLSPAGSHFWDINLLGSDYLLDHGLAIVPHRYGNKVDLIFDLSTKLEEPKSAL